MYFITSRIRTEGYTIKNQSVQWLKQHFNIENPQVIVTSYKEKFGRLLDFDYFIDDKFENVYNMWLRVKNCICFLVDYPHNHKYIPLVLRIDDIDEFVDLVLDDMLEKE